MSGTITHKSNRSIGYPVIDIATSKEDALCWTRGQDRKSVVKVAHERNITYIPVIEKGRITGIVTRDSLESDREPRITPLTADWLIAADTPILKLIELFARQPRRIHLILQASEIVGLVAPADRNKTPARASIYMLLAEFERNLTELIRKVLPDEPDYTKYLTDEQISQCRKWQERAAKDDLDADLLSYMDLRSLIDIAVSDDGLRQVLVLDSEEKVRSVKRFVTVRNAVAHPVKPLTSRRRLRALNTTCQRLFDMNDRLSRAHERLREVLKTTDKSR